MELKVTRFADFDRVCCESWPFGVFLSQETQDRHGVEVDESAMFSFDKTRVFQ